MRFFGTFHSVCRRLLNEELPLAEYGYRPGFTIYDEGERQALIGELAGEMNTGGGRSRVAELMRAVARLKQLPFLEPSAEPAAPLAVELHKRYVDRLVSANALDFDDLILLPLRMLIDHADVRERLAGRFDHVLVDEFQDTDRLQFLLLKGLLGGRESLYVVGDPNQSIYTWRGAYPEIFRRFRKEYPGASAFALAQHYRSSSTILEAANGLAGPGEGEDRPWTRNEPGPPVRLAACDDERDQADWVSREVLRLHREEGVAFGAMAVLYRINAQATRLEAALRRDGVAVRVVAPKSLLDLPPVRKLLALWKALLNPDDRLSICHAAALPAWQLTPLMLRQLEEAGERYKLTLGQVLLSLDDLDELPARTRERASLFAAALSDLGAEMTARPAVELFDLTVARSEFREKEIRVHTAAGEELWQRMLGLRRLAEEEADLDPWEAWPAFLAAVSLSGGADGNREGPSRDAVNLMTIHAAKGLEFDAVFVIGLNEGLMPLAGREEGTPEFEEERRLLFVAMTRARKHLALTHMTRVARRGVAPWPSRFVDLLPRHLVDGIGPLPDAPSAGAFLDGPGRKVAPPSRPAHPKPEFAAGDRVAHPRHGTGIVVQNSGGRIRVRFDSGEEKELLAGFSPDLELAN